MSSQRNGTRTGPMATEIELPAVGEPETLVVRRRQLAAPGPGEVVVRVETTGVSFAEKSMRRGKYPGQPKFPFVPGYDLVGIVTQVGPGVDQVVVGQRVAALTKTGGWADFVLWPAADLFPVPAEVDPAEAETAVVNGVTAWQMLHDVAKIRSGQTILVHGATSGVGVLLVQLARVAGVSVIGTASAGKQEAVRALGAAPLDYRSADLMEQVRALAPQGVDAVFDHMGGKNLLDSWLLLAPGGTLVSYAIASLLDTPISVPSLILTFLLQMGRLFLWDILPNGRHASFYNLWSGKTTKLKVFRDKQQTAQREVFALLASGRIQARVGARVPLSQVAQGMRLAESGSLVGKVVLMQDLS